jgi:plastocyanin
MSPNPLRKLFTLRRTLFSVLNIFLMLLISGWGGSTSGFAKTEAVQQTVSPTTVDVSIVDFAFQPAVIKINVGDTVKWTNNGTFIHTSTSDTGVWDSLDITPTLSYTHTFGIPGIYTYHCMHHPTVMKGAVIVGKLTYIPFVLHGS